MAVRYQKSEKKFSDFQKTLILAFLFCLGVYNSLAVGSLLVVCAFQKGCLGASKSQAAGDGRYEGFKSLTSCTFLQECPLAAIDVGESAVAFVRDWHCRFDSCLLLQSREGVDAYS